MNNVQENRNEHISNTFLKKKTVFTSGSLFLGQLNGQAINEPKSKSYHLGHYKLFSDLMYIFRPISIPSDHQNDPVIDLFWIPGGKVMDSIALYSLPFTWEGGGMNHS